MKYCLPELLETLDQFHVNNQILAKDDPPPFYIPKSLANELKNRQDPLIVVEFNQLLLFAQYLLPNNKRLIVGPISTKRLLNLSSNNSLSYLNSVQDYIQVKKMVYFAPLFTLEELQDLMQKLCELILKHPIKAVVLRRNDLQPNSFYPEDDRSFSYEELNSNLTAAIKHGDTQKVGEILAHPRVLLYDYIYQGKNSPIEMQHEFYNFVVSASRIATDAGASTVAVENIQKKYNNLWQSRQQTPEEARQMIINCLLDITQQVKDDKFFGNDDPLVRRVYTYVENNFRQQISRNSIAKELNLSPSYLSKYFKDHTGKTLTRFIQEYKTNQAEMMLESENFTVTEVADYLGVTNVTYFNRIFKKITGQTPTQYRKTH